MKTLISRVSTGLIAAVLAVAGLGMAPQEADAAPLKVAVHTPRAPAKRVDVRPMAPSARHLWVEGRWTFAHGKFTWVPGYWAAPKATWVAGRYVVQRGRTVWVPGHWT